MGFVVSDEFVHGCECLLTNDKVGSFDADPKVFITSCGLE